MIQLSKSKQQYLDEYYTAWKDWCQDIPDDILRANLERTWDELIAPYAIEQNMEKFRHPDDDKGEA